MIFVLLCPLLKVVSVTAMDASLSRVLQMEVNVCLCAYMQVRLHVTEKERLRERERANCEGNEWLAYAGQKHCVRLTAGNGHTKMKFS